MICFFLNGEFGVKTIGCFIYKPWKLNLHLLKRNHGIPGRSSIILKIDPTTYSVTSKVDVTNMVKTIKERKLKFFPSFLWLSTTIFNEMDEFRIGFKEMADGFSSFLD